MLLKKMRKKIYIWGLTIQYKYDLIFWPHIFQCQKHEKVGDLLLLFSFLGKTKSHKIPILANKADAPV